MNYIEIINSWNDAEAECIKHGRQLTYSIGLIRRAWEAH